MFVPGHVCHSFSEDFSLPLSFIVSPSKRDISTHKNSFSNPGRGGKGQPYVMSRKETEDLGLDPDESCFYMLFNDCVLWTMWKNYDITFEKTLCKHCWLVCSCSESGFRYNVSYGSLVVPPGKQKV